MKLHIYLFRHGETFYNEAKRFTGWKDSKLTPRGINSAKKIGTLLKNKKFQVAYVTHLSRSKDTMKYVIKSHPECKEIIEDDRMIERNYGKLSGCSHNSFIDREGEDDYELLLKWHKLEGSLKGDEREDFVRAVGKAELQVARRSYDVAPPGGESIKDVEARVKSFIKDLLKKMKKEKVNVAISSHGNSMRPFRRYFEKLSIDEMMDLENPWDNYFDYAVEV